MALNKDRTPVANVPGPKCRVCVALSVMDVTETAPDDRPPIGFAAHVERAPDITPEHYFTDDE